MKRVKLIIMTLFWLPLLGFATTAFSYPIAPTGQKLQTFLDRLEVTKRWLPHRAVNWATGESISRIKAHYGTHCSTFVAAAAFKLGVYILRPPDHQGLLANAQKQWLDQKGEHYGWAAVDSHLMAQQIANQGCLVVISYANPKRGRSGHIAIVRPSAKSKAEINASGPQIIQAGRNNYNSTSLSMGFRDYRHSFIKRKIVYYAHDTPFCRLLVQKGERGFSEQKTL